MKKILLVLILLLIFCNALPAQEKKDSLYYKIEKFSDKRKFTKFIHRFIFRREADSASVSTRTEKQEQSTYDGKLIRNVKIEAIDPFGYNTDEKKEKTYWYDWFTNHLHSNTRISTIRNYLLFAKGEPYNAQKLYESERLLRTMPFVNRVNIAVEQSSNDSIDVLVKVLDSWSLKPRFSYSGSKIGLGVSEENFLGLGHQADFLYRNDSKDKQDYWYASYLANNLFGSYINAQVLAEKDFFKNERITLAARRDFFSPLTKWAGGFTFEYFMRHVQLPVEDLAVFPQVQIKVYSQDLWGGYQIPVSSDPMKKISSNIALIGRFQNFQYKDNPAADKYDFFRSYNSFLVSGGFIQRKFSVEKQVYQYNLPEDIPYGNAFTATSGFMVRSKEMIPYLGLSAAYGDFTGWGYFNIKGEFGRFFNQDRQNREAFRLEGLYFTNLLNWRFAQVRHFFSPTLALGNPENNYTYRDRINLSARDEFPIYSTDYIGTKKMVLRYQLQFFINKTWKNFHFSPYITAAAGWLAMPNEKLLKTNVNTKIGVGVLINNPYLVLNRIQISFMYYPKVPFDNNSSFDFNRYRNDMMPMNNFAADIPHFVNSGN